MTEQYYSNDFGYDDTSMQANQNDNSIYSLLSRMEVMVNNAKTLPLSTNIILNRENMLTLISALQEQLPEAIKQAHYIVEEQNALLREAKQEAERYMQRAKIEAATMIDQSEITQQAQAKANEIVGQAQDKANAMHDSAVRYVNSLLTETEANLSDMIEVVRQNKQELSEWSRN